MDFEGGKMSTAESSMNTFGDDLSNKNEHAFGICSRKASKGKDQEEANKLRLDAGPWWRFADREELAYLVSQRSVNLIENCDLPNPQSSQFKLGYSGNFTPCIHLNAHAADNYKQGICNAKLAEALDTDFDPTKAQLLEALVRCQTRAREAENLANQAYAEKEHIIKLFIREASHLFAYKQWFQLLRLENLNFQTKINKNLESSIFCSVDREIREVHKIKKNHARKERIGKQNTDDYVCKFGVAFAIGFGLIGAGLLLGWRVGCFLSLF